MSKNDDRILELKKQIEAKKKTIAEKKIRFTPETNCVLYIDGVIFNLNVCSDSDLLLLLIRLHSYQMAALDLGIDRFEISGYSVTAWVDDIKSKLDVLTAKKEEADLKRMESKLDKLLSEDKKTELELDEIAALLK